MTKQELKQELKSFSGGAAFLSVEEVAKFRGQHRSTASQWLRDLPHTGVATKKLIFIGDIAEKLIEEQKYETHNIMYPSPLDHIGPCKHNPNCSLPYPGRCSL